ncbi:HD-GYP domain-containing protein (c-di-GMP phosphodiesterase class II) [Paenibacillus endophyticus]|uniref:HD-GYP domain-containing protein (C-di-GMP phosphodiesterase class II) n=1 Tax=Paenibacillus endophyticus TaxID=1294268 RepID=A0A7W5GBG3_9BACL|nr:HD-GYP domain-containing protein [Paenibacillus endophyticus]MBB3152922.1 HD-GYP domain-containing protein (c-di-GMP phosphodiesterase class II) [Paenibacillus endophyticus]
MAAVTLLHLKLGDKIIEDVLTPLGGVLFQKGKVVTPKEMELLQAFLITSVEIESNQAVSKTREDTVEDGGQESSPTIVASPLHEEYDKMVIVLRQVFNSFVAGQALPVMDIRKQLEKLLEHIKSYNLLTFAPRQFMEKDYLLHNSITCALTSYQIAQWTGFPQKDWMQIAFAGLLHDIGNVKIDKSILTKPNSLSVEEKEEMMRHTVLGYQLLKNVPALNEGVKMAALQHHEKVDGTGYPLGIDATKINPYAKIVAIADIFHAMTLNKAYRKAVSPYLVLEQIQSDAFGKLDPTYVRIFVEKATQFHNGTIVRLNDERIGEIVFSDHNYPTRPWVSIEGVIVNLISERQLHIKEVFR